MADRDNQPTKIDRWEYKMIPQSHHASENLSALNQEGAKGWELIHVGHSYTLKRRLFCTLCRELQSV